MGAGALGERQADGRHRCAGCEYPRVGLRGSSEHRGRERLDNGRSEEHTSELQSLMRISYAVFCLKKKTNTKHNKTLYSYNNTKTTLRKYCNTHTHDYPKTTTHNAKAQKHTS